MKPWARKQIEQAKKTCHRATRKTSHLELPVSGQPIHPPEGPAFTARVDIRIISYRVRFADTDGISRKAIIDGLVNCGVLKNDSRKEIKSIRHRQVKVKNISEEKTVITIEEA